MSPYLFRSSGLQAIGQIREQFYKYNIVYYNRFDVSVSTKKEKDSTVSSEICGNVSLIGSATTSHPNRRILKGKVEFGDAASENLYGNFGLFLVL